MSLLEKLKKNCRVKEAEVLAESTFFEAKDLVSVGVPMLNVGLSGRVDGGITNGLTIFAGDSKSFKSTLSLLMAAAWLKANEEGVLLFYDSEFGSPQSYFETFGIDTNRVLHVPVKNIEELKFDIVNQLEAIDKKEKVFIILDSFGNIASKKEIDDAINENSAADMSRAKALKGLFRMITPYLTLKDIPMIAIGHTYEEQKMYGKKILSGGCLLPYTKIKMADGTYKNIQDIIEGEQVDTIEGPKDVTNVWNPETLDEGEPECYEIEFEDGSIVRCSDKHMFLINDNWVEANELNIGDVCAVK